MPIKSVSSLPDPFVNLTGVDTPLQSCLTGKEDKPSLLFSQEPTSSLLSKNIFPLTDANIQQNPSLNNAIIYAGKKDGKHIFESFVGKSKEKLEAAAARDELGLVEETEGGGVVIKLSEKLTKELKSQGISSVEVRGPNGVRTYTSCNFQTLSDKELNLLITHVKTYIVFLKTQSDPADQKTEKAIEHKESHLKHLKIERAIRKKDPILKELLDGLIKTIHYEVAMRIAALRVQIKAVMERREEEAEQERLETKHIIIVEDISRRELHLNINKESVLKKDVNSHITLNGFSKQEAASKNLVNIGRFINIYNNLNGN